MASKYWIKLYHEILQDPKMGMLPDNLWRRTIELFLLAGELSIDSPEDDRGQLPEASEIAWLLRQPAAGLQEELEQLSRVGILTKTESGWLVTKFAQRQKPVEVVDRVRQYRERQRKQKPPKDKHVQVTPIDNTGYANVTKSYTESDIDIDSKTSKEVSGKPQPAGPKAKISDKFEELTSLKMPSLKKDSGYWWGQYGEILKLARGDPDLACKWESEAVSYMQANNLTITGPQSIMGMIRILASGQPLKNGVYQNGHSKRQTQKQIIPATGEQAERLKRMAAQLAGAEPDP